MTLIANKLIEVKPMPFPSRTLHYFDMFDSLARTLHYFDMFDSLGDKSLSDYSLNFQKKLMQDLFDTAFEGFPLPPFKIYKSPFENDDEYKIMPG